MGTMTTSNNQWVLSFDTPVTGTGVLTTGTTIEKTLTTAGKFLDKDIIIKATPKATIAQSVLSTTPSIINDNITSGSASIAATGFTAASSATDYYITLTTSAGSVKPTATTNITTAGYVTSAQNATVTATSATSIPVSGNNNKIYIPTAEYSTSQGVTTITTGGYIPADTVVTNIATQTPTTDYINTGISTYFNSGTSSDYNISITPRYSNTAGYISAHTNTNNGGIGYWKIKTTNRSASTGYVNLTAGNGSVTLTAGTGDSASSSNPSIIMNTTTPSSGIYYTLTAKGKGTVSGTGYGKISTGTGWITEGTTSSNTSSSSSLTSNEATTYGYIFKSVYGSAISGSLPSSLTRTEGTYRDIEIQPYGYLKIPAGYYPKDRYVFANKADASGEATAASNYSLAVSSISGSDVVTVGTLNNGYYSLTANNLSVTATLTAGIAGWFSAGSATDNDTDSVTVGKIAAGSCIVDGGVLSTSGFTKSDLALSLSSGSESNMSNITVGAKDTTNYPYYFKVNGNTPAVNGTTSASVTAITDTHTAGYIPSQAATNVKEAQSATPSVSINATSNSTYVSIKEASFNFSGGALTTTFINSNNKEITTASTDTYNNGLTVTTSRGAVQYTNTAGYIGANSTAVIASSAPNNQINYLKGVKIAAPSSGVAKFDITVPNGNTTDFITFQFQVDSSGNVSVLGPD